MNQFSNALLVFALFCLAPPLWATEPTIADGIRAFNSEEGKAEAVAIFEAILENSPSDSTSETAQSLLAEAEYALGNKDRAFWLLGQLERSASSQQRRAAALLRTAVLQMDSGMESEAIETYAELAKNFPDSKLAPMAMAFQANYHLLIRADKSRSISLYEDLAKTYPSTEEGQLALNVLPGLRKMSTAKIREASRNYKKSIQKIKNP